MYTSPYCSEFDIRNFYCSTVLSVEFAMNEYNVSESNGTVEVVLVANGTSEFDYTVNLTVYDVTTGE